MAKKTFVLDTNVILHDHECIHSFEDNDIVLPITVLEELDQFKRGSDQINFNAREFIRILDTLSGEKIVKTGTKINPKGGKIRIITDHLQEPDVTEVFTDNRPDSVLFVEARDDHCNWRCHRFKSAQTAEIARTAWQEGGICPSQGGPKRRRVEGRSPNTPCASLILAQAG